MAENEAVAIISGGSVAITLCSARTTPRNIGTYMGVGMAPGMRPKMAEKATMPLVASTLNPHKTNRPVAAEAEMRMLARPTLSPRTPGMMRRKMEAPLMIATRWPAARGA